MANLIDARYSALQTLVPTAPPHVNDMLAAWLVSEGGTGNSLPDLWYTMLISKGATPATRNDMWYEVLGGEGHTGSLRDRELSFWEAGGFA